MFSSSLPFQQQNKSFSTIRDYQQVMAQNAAAVNAANSSGFIQISPLSPVPVNAATGMIQISPLSPVPVNASDGSGMIQISPLSAASNLSANLVNHVYTANNAGTVDGISNKLHGIDLSGLALKQIPFKYLYQVTKNFSPLKVKEGGCKIGQGGYGSVFLGNLSGQQVAVKLLEDPVDKQFIAELSTLVRCKHENILALLGCSIDGPRCCLVYEYMINGSLQDRLTCHGNSPPIPAATRKSIAFGCAVGIKYLHTFAEVPMVHRDIKSANILLDKNYVPKIGDFGLARIGTRNLSSTVVVTKNPYGTDGYVAPEAYEGDVSIKLDTFSFGVVLLEILTGVSPLNRCYRESITCLTQYEDILVILDPIANWETAPALELYNIAKHCLIKVKKQRPTVSEVVDLMTTKQLF